MPPGATFALTNLEPDVELLPLLSGDNRLLFWVELPVVTFEVTPYCHSATAYRLPETHSIA